MTRDMFFRNHNVLLSSFMSYHRVYNKSALWAPLVEQELITIPELLDSPPVFGGDHIVQSFSV